MEDKKRQALFLHATNVLSTICLSKLSPRLPADIWQIQYFLNETSESFASGYLSYPHRHDFYELHVMKSGQQTYQIDGKDYPVTSGCLLLIPKNCLHTIPYRTPDISKYAICFSAPEQIPKEARGIWNAIEQSKPLFLTDAQTFINLFEMILTEAGEQQCRWMENVCSLISVLFTHLMRMYEPELRPAAIPEDIFQRESDQRVMFIERYVRDNLDQPISCDVLANYLHVSARQLNRNVQQERNVSLREFINTIKFQAACRMLSSPQCGISGLYMKLGFSDESSFNRFFKRCSGMSPSAWRKSYRMTKMEEELRNNE